MRRERRARPPKSKESDCGGGDRGRLLRLHGVGFVFRGRAVREDRAGCCQYLFLVHTRHLSAIEASSSFSVYYQYNQQFGRLRSGPRQVVGERARREVKRAPVCEFGFEHVPEFFYARDYA